MQITIAAEPLDSADARRLIRALDEHLAGRYPPEQRFGPNLKAEHLAGGFGTFVIARSGGVAVGCGAVRRLDPTTGEVKRMYVDPGARGRGVAKVILERLEAAAGAMGASSWSWRRASTRRRRSVCTAGLATARLTVLANMPACLPASALKRGSSGLA